MAQANLHTEPLDTTPRQPSLFYDLSLIPSKATDLELVPVFRAFQLGDEHAGGLHGRQPHVAAVRAQALLHCRTEQKRRE